MNNSSVFSDLKKYSGPIQGVKIQIDSEDKPKPRGRKKTEIVDVLQILNDAETETAESIVDSQPTRPNLEDLAAKVTEPFTVCRDGHGPIGDLTGLMIKCELGHAHRYNAKDISAGLSKCVTCGNGNKFTTLVRCVAENLLGVPFVMEYARGQPIEFLNQQLGIRLWCGKSSGNNTKELAGDVIIIKIYPTTQEKKIRDTFCNYLNGWPLLSAEQQNRLVPVIMKIADDNFPRIPLAHNAGTAGVFKKFDGCDTRVNEISDSLCLEDCSFNLSNT